MLCEPSISADCDCASFLPGMAFPSLAFRYLFTAGLRKEFSVLWRLRNEKNNFLAKADAAQKDGPTEDNEGNEEGHGPRAGLCPVSLIITLAFPSKCVSIGTCKARPPPLKLWRTGRSLFFEILLWDGGGKFCRSKATDGIAAQKQKAHNDGTFCAAILQNHT